MGQADRRRHRGGGRTPGRTGRQDPGALRRRPRRRPQTAGRMGAPGQRRLVPGKERRRQETLNRRASEWADSPGPFMNSTASLPGGLQAAIVDLDGTMIDTLGDFVEALNRTLAELRLPQVTRGQVATLVGQGSEHLIRSVLALVGAGA